MVQCDSWMNVHLREVICTSKASQSTLHAVSSKDFSASADPINALQDGDRFWRMPEAYIRGNTIKYLRVPDEVIDKVRDDSYNRAGDTRVVRA